jgi:hypothetical protein
MQESDAGVSDEFGSDDGPSTASRKVSRRSLLAAAGGGAILGAGVLAGGLSLTQSQGAGGSAPKTSAPATPGPPDSATARYVSTAVTSEKITVWKKAGTAASPGLLFAAPKKGPFKGIIFDNAGEPVWIDPDGLNITDLRVQQYQGKPVLTYWSGTTVEGYGIGAGTILDTSYRPIGAVRTGNGLSADLHEFTLTSRGTALLMAYPVEPADLRPVGGPPDGWILGARVQEVDVATGRVLLDWDALADVELDESYERITPSGAGSGSSPETPFDPVHINAVEADGDSALLICARHTHAIYCIDRASGQLRWKLGGRRSDFEIDRAAAFAWQHDVRRVGPGRITLFDNHRKSGKAVSSGLSVLVDENARKVTLDRRFTFRKHFGGAMGSTRVLPSGNVMVGWGTDPSVTEFTADGTAIFDADLGGPSYRVYRENWSATPAAPPDIALRAEAGGALRVYMSWNGATDVAAWQVLTGTSEAVLNPVIAVERQGFESSAVVGMAGRVQALALNGSGAVIGRSTVRIP